MSAVSPVIVQLLARMLEDSQLNVDALVGSVQRVSRELSALAFNYKGHLARAGIRSLNMQALDSQLDEGSAVLSRTLFDLQQRLLGDVQALRGLERIYTAVRPATHRPPRVLAHESPVDYFMH